MGIGWTPFSSTALEVSIAIGHDWRDPRWTARVKNLPFHQRLRFSLAGIAEVWQREKSFCT
jgi:hypothetical protein